MIESTRASIKVTFGFGQPYAKCVSWPILQSTGKAWLVQTPAGDIWVPSYRWDRMPSGTGNTGDERKYNAVVDFLRSITSTNNDALVAVRRAGKGSSDLSTTVAFTVVVRDADGLSVIEERQRTSIVPASQLKAHGDQWSVPRWVLAKKLKSNEGFKVRPVWPGLQVVQDQLRSAFDAAIAGELASKVAMLKATEEAAQQRAERDRAEADAKSVRQAAIAEDGELALAFARKRLTLEDLANSGCRLYGWPKWLPGERVDGPLEVTLASLVSAVRTHPEFAGWRAKNVLRQGALLKSPKAPPRRQPDRVIKNCIVEWREYLGSANNLRGVDHRDEGCTVEIYGKKHEIELPDGRIVTKMAGPNLKVIERRPNEANA